MLDDYHETAVVFSVKSRLKHDDEAFEKHFAIVNISSCPWLGEKLFS